MAAWCAEKKKRGHLVGLHVVFSTPNMADIVVEFSADVHVVLRAIFF